MKTKIKNKMKIVKWILKSLMKKKLRRSRTAIRRDHENQECDSPDTKGQKLQT